jgi:diketogulonate reductase-like aldo/keto reductase
VDRNLQLSNGIAMPRLGLGVDRLPASETASIVAVAIAGGYCLIDTAARYGNEAEVGQGVRRSGVARDEVFVTTKLWIADYGYRAALRAFDASLGRLGLDYVDLYLLHWPAPSTFASTIGAYRAAESIVADGRARAIGVCNHHVGHLEALRRSCDLMPVVNQVELHPWFNQLALRRRHQELGIVTQSWSPLGGIYVDGATGRDTGRTPLDEPIVVALGAKYSKTPAQIVIRWHLQHGCSAIPKSAQPYRLAENMDVFDFALSSSDMATIDSLETGIRGGPEPQEFDLAHLADLGVT